MTMLLLMSASPIQLTAAAAAAVRDEYGQVERIRGKRGRRMWIYCMCLVIHDVGFVVIQNVGGLGDSDLGNCSTISSLEDI
jgi:hypothetical protein